jgi:hypothetical protein
MHLGKSEKRKGEKEKGKIKYSVRMTGAVVCVRAGLADASDVSGTTQTWTKSERQMARSDSLSVWVGPLGCLFCIFVSARIDSDRG